MFLNVSRKLIPVFRKFKNFCTCLQFLSRISRLTRLLPTFEICLNLKIFSKNFREVFQFFRRILWSTNFWNIFPTVWKLRDLAFSGFLNFSFFFVMCFFITKFSLGLTAIFSNFKTKSGENGFLSIFDMPFDCFYISKFS